MGEEDLVHIVFNGVNITNTTSSVFNGATGRKIVLTLVDGTTNTITDGTTYQYAEGEDEPDATFFVRQDLTINGNGTPPSGAPVENGGTSSSGNGSMGQPPEKPTDANGNELEMPSENKG